MPTFLDQLVLPPVAPNTVLIGPASGAVDVPTQRVLMPADLPQSNAVVTLYDDFISGGGSQLFYNGSNGGGVATNGTDDGGHPGIAQLSTGTTTTGSGTLGVSGSGGLTAIRLGYGAWTHEAFVRVPTLSTDTDTFILFLGFGDSRTGEPTDGVYFRYVHTVNSGKFQAVTRSNGTSTTTDTGVTLVAGTWYKLRFVIAADASSVVFLINGTVVATITTNIPTGAGRETGILWSILKSVGTTSRLVEADYLLYQCVLTTAR